MPFRIVILEYSSIPVVIIESKYQTIFSLLTPCFDTKSDKCLSFMCVDPTSLLPVSSQTSCPVLSLVTNNTSFGLNFTTAFVSQITPFIVTFFNPINGVISALRKNNFVYSPAVTPILSRITNNYSNCLDPDWLKLKVAFDNDNFGLSRYCIIAEDEKATNQDKKESDYQNNAKVDDGIPEFFRLIRNAGKGSMTYVTCNQDAARWVSVERHLMFSNLSIQNFQIKRTHRPLMMFYGLLNGIIKLFYKFIAFLHFNKVARENFLNRENIFKKINRFFVEKDNKLFSKSVIVYTVNNYHDIDDIGKENTEANTYYKKLKLFFPITYAFGCIDTHIYAHIFDKLIESSKVSSFDVYSNRKDLTEEEKYNEMKRILDRSLKAKNKLNKTSGLSSNPGEVSAPDDDENLPSAF